MFAITLTDDDRRRHEQLLREAIRLAGFTMDRAAQEAEIGAPQFTRLVQLQEGTYKRLAMLPREFWQWLAVLIGNEFGLPKEAKQALRLHRRARAFKRMARMSLRVNQQERKTA